MLARLGRALARPKRARPVLAVYGATIIGSLMVVPRLTADSSLIRQFPDRAPIRLATDFVNSRFAGSSFLLLLVEDEAPGALATPTAIQAISTLQRQIEQLPTVGRAISFVDTLSALHQALGSPRGDSAATDLPDSRGLIEQYFLLYSMSGGADLNTMITPDFGAAKIVVFLKDDSTLPGRKTIDRIREFSKNTLPPSFKVRIAGTVASDIALTDVMVAGKLANIVQVTAITTFISSVIFRSVLVGLLVSAPLALSVMLNFVLMWALAIPLDVTTSAVAAMAVGLGADYAIYMMFRIREELVTGLALEQALVTAMATSGQAVLLVAAAIGLGYSVLGLAGFAVYRNLGTLIAASMITSSLASVTVIPAFVTTWLHARRGGLFGQPTIVDRREASVPPEADKRWNRS